jgi:hypothetical protein
MAIALLAGLGALWRPAFGQELLSNGGFEQGLTSWIHDGASTSGCPARSGATAVALVNDATETSPIVHQTISGPFGGGPWVLTGWIKANSSPDVTIQLIWLAGGIPLERVTIDLTPGPEYARFSLVATEPEDAAQALRVHVRLNGDAPGAVVCLDDLSLEEGPLPTATPTHSPTPTTEPSPVDTTGPAPSATPATSVTPASTTGPSFTFVNGGFEDGLSGWSKFGGELLHVAGPRRSGSGAGRLLSDTDSTKWAFQTVVVDPEQYYEFAGYLQPDAGAGSAYLRISWYASSDGTGSALDTTDSTSTIGGGSSSFQFLTTGAVKPPAGAQSARLRAVLTPAGAGVANLFLDDFSFAQVPPPPPTATPAPSLTVTVAATPGSTVAPTQSAPSTTVAGQTPSAPGATSTTETPGDDDNEPLATGGTTASPRTMTNRDQPTPEPSSTGVVQTPRARAPVQPQPLADPDEDGDGGGGVPVLWIIGLALFAAGAGGAYLRARRQL